jgi:hypothetical protein
MRKGVTLHIKTGMTVTIDIEHGYLEVDVFL